MGYKEQKEDTMVVVQIYPLRLPQKQAQRCAEVRREAGACWNRIVELAQEHYRAAKTWIGEGELKVKVKRTFKLHSQTVQALVEKYVANRETTTALRRQGRTEIKYPYRHKAHQTPAWKRQGFEVKGNRLVLKLSRGQEPLVLPHPAPGVEPKLVELTWENGRYYLHLTVEQPKPQQIAGDRLAAVDLGEIHAITMTDESEALAVSGRLIRSVKRYRNKRVGAIQKAMGRCKKGSRKWKRLMRAKHRVQARTDAQLKNLHHQVTAKVVAHCIRRGITRVVIGNPRRGPAGIRHRPHSPSLQAQGPWRDRQR
ncbi:MAG: transposase [Actinobacteria bacterium]|nr:transposase [Actinomycetota bacterium]